jgi:Uma2 family endonuclease
MMVTKRNPLMTVQDFLALDRENFDQKYEYIHGEIVAMAGGTVNHSITIGNITSLIRPHLRGKPCRVLSEGTLKIEAACYLPDVMVTCNEQDITENKTYIEHPKLVIEVLSPSTEHIDKSDKLLAYTQCASIQEYVLVNWDMVFIQKMTRKGTQGLDRIQWLDEWYHQGDILELETIGLSIPVESIYEDILLPPFDPFRGFRKQRREHFSPNG